jgi:DNA-binding NarL/FixJ family response regulator
MAAADALYQTITDPPPPEPDATAPEIAVADVEIAVADVEVGDAEAEPDVTAADPGAAATESGAEPRSRVREPRSRVPVAGVAATESDPTAAEIHAESSADTADTTGDQLAGEAEPAGGLEARVDAEFVAEQAGAYDRELCMRLEATVMLVGAADRSTLTRVRQRLATVPEPAGDTPADRYLMAMHAMERAVAGTEPERAVALARGALPLDPAGYVNPTAAVAACVFAVADELPQALAALDPMIANDEANGELWSHCRTLGLRAHVRYTSGDLAGAAADARLSLELAREEGWGPESMGASALALALSLIPLGELDEARSVLDSVTGTGMEDSPFERQTLMQAKAFVRAASGELDKGIELLQQCGRGLEQDGVTNPLFLPWWAEATLLLAERGRARAALPLVEYGEDLVARWDVPRARALARTARAMVSRGTERIDLLTDAAAAMESSGALLERQRVVHLLGRELLRREDQKAAREHLRTAADLASWCGATAAAVDARDLLLSAGGRMRQVTGARTDVLTSSELRVVELAVGGATNREIGEELFVTSRTVEVHLTNAYRKLGIAGRADLPAALRELTENSPVDAGKG